MSEKPILFNVKSLRDSLRDAGWCMTAFSFTFNSVESLVLFEDAKALGRTDPYTIAILTFMDLSNADHSVEISANSHNIELGHSKDAFFSFFNIQPSDPSDFFKHFKQELNKSVPSKFVIPSEHDVINAISHQLGVRNGDRDPNAIYCYDAFRLPINTHSKKQMHRTSFLDTKTRMLRPRLYELIHAETEPTITFRYSADSKKELCDEDILRQFASRDT